MKQALFIFILTILTLTTLHAAPSASDLTGNWVATIEHNNSFDTYKINLSHNEVE